MSIKVENVLDPSFKEEVTRVLADFQKDLYQLHDLAIKDEKTGIYNHRFFKNVFELEIERAKRGMQKLSLAIVDLDFFKKINDSHGHVEGDKILREVAQEITRTIRNYDILARFGGEEFFILLPGATLTKGKTISERIRKNIEKNKKLKKYSVTVSIGITEYKKSDNSERLTKRADKALYKAKDNGRNQVATIK
jgi:diguanylate cyclase (GGDEF)-like protein